MHKPFAVVDAATIPDGIRFDVAPQDAGQTVEVAYGGSINARSMWDSSDATYKRVTDQSIGLDVDGRVTYYRR